MLLVSVGHLAGWKETWGGAELHPLQKSKAFIKNAINWYQKKTQGRLEEEAGGRWAESTQRKDRNLGPLWTESRLQSRQEGKAWGKLGR